MVRALAAEMFSLRLFLFNDLICVIDDLNRRSMAPACAIDAPGMVAVLVENPSDWICILINVVSNIIFTLKARNVNGKLQNTYVKR